MEPKMLNELVKLPHAAQIIYLQLLNRAAQGTVTVSDRDLATSCRLNAQSITDGKRALKNAEFVDFKTERGKPTTYQLVHLQVQFRVHPEDNTNNVCIPPPPPPPPPAYARRLDELERRIAALEAKSAPSAPVQSAPSEELDRVIAEWERRPTFAPLDFPAISKFENLLKEYTADELIEAMNEASLGNAASEANSGRFSGVAYNFFESVLKRLYKKPPVKAVDRKEGKKDDGGIKYRAPRSDGAKPWRKRDTIGEPVASETSVG